jgi:hypothetical protein
MQLKSHYRFPYCLKDYVNPKRYLRVGQHWLERARKGYSFSDLWSLDYHIARIYIDALPTYQHRNGTVLLYVLDEDRTDAHYNGTYTDEERNEVMDRWDAMVDEIIAGLNAVYGDDGKLYDEEAWKQLERSLQLVSKYFTSFWI